MYLKDIWRRWNENYRIPFCNVSQNSILTKTMPFAKIKNIEKIKVMRKRSTHCAPKERMARWLKGSPGGRMRKVAFELGV